MRDVFFGCLAAIHYKGLSPQLTQRLRRMGFTAKGAFALTSLFRNSLRGCLRASFLQAWFWNLCWNLHSFLIRRWGSRRRRRGRGRIWDSHAVKSLMAKGRCRQGFKVGMVKICFQVKWATTPSVPCRTSTTTIHAQCSLPDLNREYPRQVFPAGPHVGRYGTKNVQKKVRKNVRQVCYTLLANSRVCGRVTGVRVIPCVLEIPYFQGTTLL